MSDPIPLFPAPAEAPAAEPRPEPVALPTRPARQGRCSQCHATVLFVPTEASRGTTIMPLDVDDTADGLCFLVAAATGTGEPWVRVLGHGKPVPPELAGARRMSTHMWSCPRDHLQPRRRPSR